MLSASAKIGEINRQYQQKEDLIQRAKAEWVKKTLPAEKKTEGGGGELCFSFGFVVLLLGEMGWDKEEWRRDEGKD